MTKSIEERIKYLEECANLYETNGNSPLSDEEYDAEKEACFKIQPNHPFFSSVGGLDEGHIYGTLVKHEVIMGSLHKSPDIADFSKWIASTYKDEETFIIQHKVDGLSMGVIYKNGKLQMAVTRGNGIEGVDVTENARYVNGIPATIPFDEEVEIRGEVYKDRADFYKTWAGQYANPRNFSAGSLNQKDSKVTKERGLDFIAYEVVRKQFDAETQKIDFLVKANFNTLKDSTRLVKGNSAHIAKAVESYMNGIDRTKLPYDIDGVVVKLNDIRKAKALGSTSEGRKPKANRAVKFACEQKETTLEGVEWNVKRTGKITPVGLLKPVQLAGTIVQRVSLHNVKFIESMGLTGGCKVLIQKSGDIIPYIVRKTASGNLPLSIPDKCPTCKFDLVWDDTKTSKVCKNEECPSQLCAKIDHWFKTIGVKGIGEGIIERLLEDENGEVYVWKLLDMYTLAKSKCKLEKVFGERAFANILEAIDSVKEISLAKFIEAYGIGKIGTMASEITAIAPTVDDVNKLTVKDLLGIQGFGEKKANGFIDGWKDNIKEINEILTHVTIKSKAQASNKLAGKKFCFTGSFSSPSRGDMEAMVPEHGGKLGSVSKDLTALVWDGETMKGKYEKASSLKIPIITQKEFLAMVK